MLRPVVLLLLLYGIGTIVGRPQTDPESREAVESSGVEKSGVGAGGSGGGGLRSAVVDRVLGREVGEGGGIGAGAADWPERRHLSVASPALRVSGARPGWTKTTTAVPAMAVVVDTYDADGRLRTSVTYFLSSGAPRRTAHAPQFGSRPFSSAARAPFLPAREEWFDEVTLGAEVKLTRPTAEPSDGSGRRRRRRRRSKRTSRDTTAITVNFKNGDRVDLEVADPKPKSEGIRPAEPEERTRAHSVMLVNPPPLSSIPRPSSTGFNAKKKAKPQKPDKEEGSEEVGEETEDTTSQGGSADGVAISPPPDGASVAEAKPVGLAIAGPGGVAAAKPQGTAVAGPGGLAIARPIGTAIAGVEVEGTVPIGGQQKNKKKKPKQDPEKMDGEMDTELHYVGGLTGPIGNPQPNTKDFGKAAVQSRNHDNLLFQGKYNENGYQLKLGEHDGKYGFLPVAVSPEKTGQRSIQKRMDQPTFFHGLLGNRNLQEQGPRSQVYPNFYY